MITVRWWELLVGIVLGDFVSALIGAEEVGRRLARRMTGRAGQRVDQDAADG